MSQNLYESISLSLGIYVLVPCRGLGPRTIWEFGKLSTIRLRVDTPDHLEPQSLSGCGWSQCLLILRDALARSLGSSSANVQSAQSLLELVGIDEVIGPVGAATADRPGRLGAGVVLLKVSGSAILLKLVNAMLVRGSGGTSGGFLWRIFGRLRELLLHIVRWMELGKECSTVRYQMAQSVVVSLKTMESK